jgi:hypothetical protein
MMDVEQIIPAEFSTALSRTDQRRLERLAKLAGRTPRSMLRFVLRDGFAACEESVLESQKADHEFAIGKSFEHAEVMQSARQLLSSYAKRAGQTD